MASCFERVRYNLIYSLLFDLIVGIKSQLASYANDLLSITSSIMYLIFYRIKIITSITTRTLLFEPLAIFF